MLWTPDYSRINLWLIHMGVWQIGERHLGGGGGQSAQIGEMHNLEQSKDY